MKVFGKDGQEVDIPDEQAQQALTSGEYGLPAGSRVPIKTKDGKVGTIPVEHLPTAVHAGARMLSEEEHAEHTHGGAANAILAGVEQAAQGATFNLAEPALIKALKTVSPEKSEELRQHFNAEKAAHPYLGGAANIGGQIASTFATDGLGEAGAEGKIEADAAAREAEALATKQAEQHVAPEGAELKGGPHPYRQAPTAPAAPMGPSPEAVAGRLAEHGGSVPLATGEALTSKVAEDAATRHVVENLGEPGQTLLTRLAKHAVTGAAYGTAQGAGDAISEDTLSASHALTAQKLMAAMGEGAIFGGLVGTGLGVGGEALGRTAKAAGGLADEQYFRSMLTGGDSAAVRQADALPGGRKALGRMMEKNGLIGMGDKAADMLEKTDEFVPKAGELVGHFRRQMDEAGVQGPHISAIAGQLEDKIGKALAEMPRTMAPQRDFLDRVKGDLESWTWPNNGLMTFEQAQAKKAMINEQINSWGPRAGWTEETFGKQKILRAAYHAIEDATEAAGERGEKQMGGKFLEPYKAAKLEYRQALTAQKILEHSSHKTGGNLQFGLGSMLSGIMGTIGLHGIPGGGLAASLLYKTARERGNSTSAALLDKLATLGGVQNAIARNDREAQRGISRMLTPGKHAEPKFNLKDSTVEQRMDYVRKTLAGQIEPGAHLAEPLGKHAPNVAKAITATSARAVNYLASLLPAPYQASSLVPPPKKAEFANWTQKAKFDRAYTAIAEPNVLLQHCADGTLTRDEVEAVKNVHPDWYLARCQEIVAAVGEHGKTVPNRTLIDLSVFLGHPVTPLMDPRILAQLQGNKPTPTPGGTSHGKKLKGVGPMKPLHTAPKDAGKSVSLTGLSKETLL